MKSILIVLLIALFFTAYSVISLEEVFSFQKNLEMKQFLGLGSLFIGLGMFAGSIFYIIDGIWGLGTWKCEAELMYFSSSKTYPIILFPVANIAIHWFCNISLFSY